MVKLLQWLFCFSGRIALGVGDNMIRVWNMNNTTNAFDVATLWQGIRSKVTAVSSP